MLKPVATRKKRVALVNPQKKAKKAASSGAPRRNPGNLFALGYLNPEKKQMKEKTKRRPVTVAPKKAAKSRTVRRNPLPIVAMSATKKKRRKRNPEGLITRNTPSEMVKGAVAAAIGMLATRSAPQFALGAKNTGIKGYLANIGTALVTSIAASKMFGRQIGYATLIGGSLATLQRVVSDQTVLGKQLNLTGVGDAHAAGRLNGVIVPAYFPHPVVYDASGKPVIPAEINAAAAAAKVAELMQPPAAPAQTMGRYSRPRFAVA